MQWFYFICHLSVFSSCSHVWLNPHVFPWPKIKSTIKFKRYHHSVSPWQSLFPFWWRQNHPSRGKIFYFKPEHLHCASWSVTLLPWQLIAFPVSMLRSWLVLDLLGNNNEVGSRKQKLEQNPFHSCKTEIKRTFLTTASTSQRNTPTHKSTNTFGGVKHDVGPPWPQHCLWSFLASLTAWLYGLKGPDVRVLLRPDLHLSV